MASARVSVQSPPFVTHNRYAQALPFLLKKNAAFSLVLSLFLISVEALINPCQIFVCTG